MYENFRSAPLRLMWGTGNGEPVTRNQKQETKISILELKLQTRTIICSPSPLIFTSNFLNLPNLLSLPNLFRVARESGRFSVAATGGVLCHFSLVTP
jgi:hypothetical protein